MDEELDLVAIEKELLLPSILLAMISLIGIPGNTQIIYVTIKYKFLHNRCNILMAILAVADIFHQLAPFPLLYFVSTRNLFISQNACFYIQLVPAFFTLHSVTIIFAVGIDRMICVFFPIRYASFKRMRIYILYFNLLGLIYSLGMVFYSFFELSTHAEDSVVCSIVKFFAGSSVSFWQWTSICFILFTILLYSLVWIRLQIGKDVTNSRRQAMKPVTVLVGLYIFGWVLGMSIRPVGKIFGCTETRLAILSTYGGLGPNFAIAMNYFVYRKFSSEHQRAFLLLCDNTRTAAVSPVFT